MLRFFDTNGDGQIDRAEFLRLWETAFDEDFTPPDDDDDVVPPVPDEDDSAIC